MDPNAALARIRHLASLLGDSDTDTSEGNIRARLIWAAEMADSFEALDHWLTRKGFLPSAWERKV